MKQNIYIKYPLNYKLIFDIFNKLNKKKINFFIDFNSICKGFYKADTVMYELSEYIETGSVSGQLMKELRSWLNELFLIFKKTDPFFILFFDDGQCLQNKLLMSTYKSNRNISNLMIGNDYKATEIFRTIKHYYYLKIKEDIPKKDLCSVVYSPEYETDIVPFYAIQNNLYDSAEDDILNVILSLDKDLLQTCEYNNTIQCPTGFKADKSKGKYVINFQIYDRNNAIKYIYHNFQPGVLTAKYIPIILSLSGDTSDGIIGINGIGPSKAVKLLEKNQIPAKLSEIKTNLTKLPKLFQDNIDIISRNMKLIDFNEQIKRLPEGFING